MSMCPFMIEPFLNYRWNYEHDSRGFLRVSLCDGKNVANYKQPKWIMLKVEQMSSVRVQIRAFLVDKTEDQRIQLKQKGFQRKKSCGRNSISSQGLKLKGRLAEKNCHWRCHINWERNCVWYMDTEVIEALNPIDDSFFPNL